MNAALIDLLARAGAEQGGGNSAAALALYEQALPQLGPFPAERARVLFHMAQLARYEGQGERALALYDELLPLTESLKDARAHGLGVAMRGQLVFLRGDQASGLRGMVAGLAELRACGAAEAEHLTCHTRYFSRRVKREVYEQCVREGAEDAGLRETLLAAEGC
jgi:hypothetical protein